MGLGFESGLALVHDFAAIVAGANVRAIVA